MNFPLKEGNDGSIMSLGKSEQDVGFAAMSVSWTRCDSRVLHDITVGGGWVKSYEGSLRILSSDCM